MLLEHPYWEGVVVRRLSSIKSNLRHRGVIAVEVGGRSEEMAGMSVS